MKKILLFIFLSELFLLVNAQNNQQADCVIYLEEYNINHITDAGDYLWLSVTDTTFDLLTGWYPFAPKIIKFEKSTGKICQLFSPEDMGIQLNTNSFNLIVLGQIELDKYGSPWVLTSDGLFKMAEYDKWIRINPITPRAILSSRDSAVWILQTVNKLIRYSGGNKIQSFFLYDVSFQSLAEDAFGNLWSCQSYIQPNHQLWDGSFNVFMFDGENCTTLKLICDTEINLFKINNLSIDSQNTKWMTGFTFNDEDKLLSYNDTTLTIYDVPHRTNSSTIVPALHSLAFEQDKIWIKTLNSLLRFDKFEWNIYDSSNSGLPASDFNSLVIDKEGTKWVGTNKGLVAFNEKLIVTSAENRKVTQNRIEVYPNPSNDYINLKIPSDFIGTFAEICDIQGKCLKSILVNNPYNQIDIRELSVGIYIIRLQNNEGYQNVKFLKQQAW